MVDRNDTLLVAEVSEILKGSPIADLFRDAMVKEVLRIARPLIEGPILEKLKDIKGRVESPDATDEDLARLLNETLVKLARGSSDELS